MHGRRTKADHNSTSCSGELKIMLKHEGIQMHLCSKPLASNEAICEVFVKVYGS